MKRVQRFTRLILLIVGIATSGLSGCATSDYTTYATAQYQMQVARSNAEEARYTAMAAIAADGDTTTRVAAMMAMMGLSGQQQAQTAAMSPPKPVADSIREWASILVPAAASMYLGHEAANVAIAGVNATAATSESTNNAFVGISGKIQAPTTTTTTNNSSTDYHGVSGSYNPATTTIPAQP